MYSGPALICMAQPQSDSESLGFPVLNFTLPLLAAFDMRNGLLWLPDS